MLSRMSTSAAGGEALEMRAGPLILRLHSRIFEVFSTESAYNARWHVDTVIFAAREPDRHGRVKVQIGLDKGGELDLGAERASIELDPEEWERFQALVAVVKHVQAAGPETW